MPGKERQGKWGPKRPVYQTGQWGVGSSDGGRKDVRTRRWKRASVQGGGRVKGHADHMTVHTPIEPACKGQEGTRFTLCQSHILIPSPGWSVPDRPAVGSECPSLLPSVTAWSPGKTGHVTHLPPADFHRSPAAAAKALGSSWAAPNLSPHLPSINPHPFT